MPKFGRRVPNSITVPAQDLVGDARRRTWVGVDAPDEEQDEDEETGESEDGEWRDEDEDGDEWGGEPALFIRRRHAGAAPPNEKFAGWAISPQVQPAETCGPRFCIP